MLNHSLCRRHQPRRRPKIYFVRRTVTQRLMKPLFVVEPKISHKAGTGFGDRPVFVKINLLVFYGPPESFNKDIIVHPAPPVHADLDAVALQTRRELVARILRALVGIENPGFGDPKRPLQRIYTKRLVQRCRKLPREDITGVPVHDHRQEDEAVGQANVGDVRRPSFIRRLDRHPFQQIGVNLVVRPVGRQPRLRIDGPQAPSTASAG